jgi:protein gp37
VSEKTGIAWTDHTFNPWWGCVPVSPGCDNCYAETFSHRLGLDLWGPKAPRRFFGDKHWNEPRRWNREALETFGRPARVFCASMADVFEDRRDLDPWRERLFALIEETPNLRWQLLTKRPENMRRLAPARWDEAWPSNVWAMTTAENMKMFLRRADHLARIPAGVLGISAEPLIEALDFDDEPIDPESPGGPFSLLDFFGISWVIVGGESAQRREDARPFNLAWARKIVDHCRRYDIAVFVKQLGARPFLHEQGSIDHQQPGLSLKVSSLEINTSIALRHPKGEDPEEWPADLRVREFPA